MCFHHHPRLLVHGRVIGGGLLVNLSFGFFEEGERFATCVLALEDAELLAALGLDRVSIILALLEEAHEHVKERRLDMVIGYMMLTKVQGHSVVHNFELLSLFCF